MRPVHSPVSAPRAVVAPAFWTLVFIGLTACSSGGDDVAVVADTESPEDITTAEVSADIGPGEDVGCACPELAPVCGHFECIANECVTVWDAVGASCDDGLPCTTEDACIVGGDGRICASASTTCGDGDLCNGDEVCTATGCQAGTALSCVDEDVCNGTELCSPTIGCLPGTALLCDNGNACDGAEQCLKGSGCAGGEPISCDDGSECTSDSCDPAGGCVHVPSGAAGCCTTGAQCDDQNPCTVDTCAADGACQNAPSTAACDDGDPCTADDVCSGGSCGGTQRSGCAVVCSVTHAENGLGDCELRVARLGAPPSASSLSLGIAWSGGGSLVGLVDRLCAGPVCGVTVLAAGGQFGATGHVAYVDPIDPSEWDGQGRLELSPLLIDEAPLSGARVEAETLTGDPFVLGLRLIGPPGSVTSVVAYDLVALGGTKSLTASVQGTGTTTPGLILTTDAPCGAVACWDGNGCTADQCVDGECSFPPTTGACDDGDPCTAASECNPFGACVPTLLAPKGTACSGTDKCLEVGVCTEQGVCETDPSLGPKCDEGNGPCTNATCDPKTGGCLIDVHVGAACDDGDACTEADVCDGAGLCAGAERDCDDGIDCTLDACTEADCVHTPKDAICEDGLPCSVNTCDMQTGCKSVVSAVPCDDGDVCTVGDTCITAALCRGQAAPGCGCTSAKDCEPYDDGDLCNGTMMCEAGHCKLDPSSVVTCPYDGVECKVDWTCAPTTGKCTGKAVSCDDSDPCTTDACSPILGCTHTMLVGCAENWLCTLTGKAGDVAVCPVRLARATKDSIAASSADIALTWDPGLTVENLQDTACYGTLCFDYDLVNCETGPCVTETLSPTGHSIILTPEKMAQWTDWFSLFLFHVGAPDTALSTVYLDEAGEPLSDPTIFSVRFVLGADATDIAPLKVFVKDLALQPASGLPLVSRVKTTSVGRIIVTD